MFCLRNMIILTEIGRQEKNNLNQQNFYNMLRITRGDINEMVSSALSEIAKRWSDHGKSHIYINDLRFHREIYWPGLDDKISALYAQNRGGFKPSSRCVSKIGCDKAHDIDVDRLVDIANNLDLDSDDVYVFEALASFNTVTHEYEIRKFVVRTKYDNFNSISIVFGVEGKPTIVTAWLYKLNDKHKTLDLTRYVQSKKDRVAIVNRHMGKTQPQTINEISSSDAYDKFYSEIPQNIYSAVMSDTNKMTPFHKALLDVTLNLIRHGSAEQNILEYIYGAKSRYDSLTQGQKMFCVKAIKDGMFGFTDSHFDLNKILRMSAKHVEVTNKKQAKNGLVVLYDDENIMVTCTLTYTASRHYYGKTHWCTASGIDGQMSGYQSFRTYVKNDGGDYCLIQFVFKKQTDKMYQGLFNATQDIRDFKDFYDDGDIDTFDEVVEYANSIVPDLYEKYVKPRIPELVRLTSEAYVKEEDAMRPKLVKKANEIISKLPKLPTVEWLNERLDGANSITQISLRLEAFSVAMRGNDDYTLFTLSQKITSLSDYQFLAHTKDITKVTTQSKAFVYSWNNREVMQIPEEFSDDKNRVLLLFGHYLFSCALHEEYDTNILNLYNMETKHYDAKYDGILMGMARFELENGDGILFSTKTGEKVG